MLDGFSEGWGFSWTDFGANAAGMGLFMLSKATKKDYFTLKYSFTPSQYRELRPSLLGKNNLSSLIKDYNGQAYWVSVNVSAITNVKTIPSWLSVALGYGAEGLLGGKGNPVISNEGLVLPYVERCSKFYLSPDIDFTKIKTKNVYLKTLLKALSFYKFPLPVLEFNSKSQWKFHLFK